MPRPFRFGVLCEEMGTCEAWFAQVMRAQFASLHAFVQHPNNRLLNRTIESRFDLLLLCVPTYYALPH